MACGQNANGRAYWTEYAFCAIPVRGPAKAKGLILWSHGVDGKNEQFRSPPPLLVKRMGYAGWDVVKINRNNLYETCSTAGGNILNCWTGGAKHVDDLIERARQARAQGYSKVVAAGQSFGGAISIEASAKAPDLFHAVIALSPGHGSDVGSGTWSTGTYYSLDKQLLDALAKPRSARLVILLPPGDAYHPNRYKDPIGPKVHSALLANGAAFVQFDETLPINGHGAAMTNQFDAWFGSCIRDFVDPARSPVAGETRCPPPTVLAPFLLPANLATPTPGANGTARWLGAWKGAYSDSKRELMVVVERIDGQTAALLYSWGPGPNRDLSMGWNRYDKVRIDGNTIKVDRGEGRTLELMLASDGASVEAVHRYKDLRSTATLTRPTGGKL